MKIIDVKHPGIPEIKIIRFKRFSDQRGYFSETFRRSDLSKYISCLSETPFVQANESFSLPFAIRGLHFQWNPYMGKLVRTISGHMIDLVLDIRKDSPTYGKIAGHDMPAEKGSDFNEWIWVPPGFAHGNYFLEETVIEYMCTGEYSQGCEAGISPFSADIDWSLCDEKIKSQFNELAEKGFIASEKDKNGLTVEQWTQDVRSENFMYGAI